MRKTKIVATIGPASSSVLVLTDLIKSGVDVARLNFSHGTHESHYEIIQNIRKAEKSAGREIAIMMDTMGPEIRTGKFKDQKAFLVQGSEVIVTPDDLLGDERKFSVTYDYICTDLKPGDRILIDDGLIELMVTKIEKNDIYTNVITGGEISNNKGVNLPNKKLSLPSLIDKDIADLEFGIRHKLDYVAASFVRSGKDVLEIRKIIERENSDMDIIAKIENAEGVENIEEILVLADGVMVARGDLGVEIPPEEVPVVQKKIIKQANIIGKPVITATQMLDSMMRNPRPTRAEASDVANAILDGTDAIMLSGETAAGKYPLLSVVMMDRIAKKTEKEMGFFEKNENFIPLKNTIPDSIASAACRLSRNLEAKAIITSTTSGSTAKMVSKYRPQSRIIAATPSERVYKKLKLVWGVESVITSQNDGTDEMIRSAVNTSLMEGLISNGDLVIITAGVPVKVQGTTNLIKVEVVGKVIVSGSGLGEGTISGRVRLVRDPAAAGEIEAEDILVSYSTDKDYVPLMKNAKAFVTEMGGLTSHTAIAAYSMKKPALIGAKDAVSCLREGDMITLDLDRGVIYLK